MKYITTLTASLFISLFASISWSEALTANDLVKRNDLYYEKFTDVPFTGEISGKEMGQLKSGRREGSWKIYYDNGQLKNTGHYKNGKRDGLWEYFNDDGTLRFDGNYKDGKQNGFQKSYFKNWRDDIN